MWNTFFSRVASTPYTSSVGYSEFNVCIVYVYIYWHFAFIVLSSARCKAFSMLMKHVACRASVLIRQELISSGQWRMRWAVSVECSVPPQHGSKLHPPPRDYREDAEWRGEGSPQHSAGLHTQGKYWPLELSTNLREVRCTTQKSHTWASYRV